jgi:LPXTG-motif cell wall-anchored protein
VESEALYIVVLITPWLLALVAVLFYRRRRKRKAREE